jgi:hypothetical protein
MKQMIGIAAVMIILTMANQPASAVDQGRISGCKRPGAACQCNHRHACFEMRQYCVEEMQCLLVCRRKDDCKEVCTCIAAVGRKSTWFKRAPVRPRSQ